MQRANGRWVPSEALPHSADLPVRDIAQTKGWSRKFASVETVHLMPTKTAQVEEIDR